MSRTVKILFVIFNIALFFANYVLVPFLPKTLFFGWMPSQFAFMVASMLLASLVWGLYFNAFYNTQGHIDERFKEEEIK